MGEFYLPMRLLAINQVTGPLFRELLEDLAADGFDIVCVSGQIDAPAGAALPFAVEPAQPLRKSPALQRLWTWGKFTWQAWRAMARHRGRLALLVTNPPLVPWIGPLAKRLLGVRYAVLVYDIYPDAMARLGMIRPGGLIERLLRKLSRESLRQAECVITLGETMAELLREHIGRPGWDDVRVIDNWADTDFINPIPKADNDFLKSLGLADKFVVTYSGAFGATHGVETIVAAAELCKDRPDVHFLLIGGGTEEDRIGGMVNDKNLSNLTLLPFQPLEALPQTLGSADCLIISLGSEYAGISVPSKTYYALAAGACLLALAGDDTELARLVRRHDCGRVIAPGVAQALADEVVALADAPSETQRLGANARVAAERSYDRAALTARYASLLRSCIADR